LGPRQAGQLAAEREMVTKAKTNVSKRWREVFIGG
jgi:hypothetical protein